MPDEAKLPGYKIYINSGQKLNMCCKVFDSWGLYIFIHI